MTGAGESRLQALRRNEFARFLVVGGFAAAVNIASRYLLSFVMGYSAAIVIAYLIGMTTAYVLSALHVFPPSGRARHEEFLGFALVNGAALLQVWGVSVGLARYGFPALGFTWHAEDVAHVIGVLVPAVTSYFGHKYLSFRPRRPDGGA